MKRIVLFLSMLLVVILSHAQQDIFKKHGHSKEAFTLSKGKYQETFPNEEIVQIGTVLINTNTGKVIEFLEEDTTMFAYKAETSSRFLTIDPHAERYYNWSPYVYCLNNPMKYIDPDGRDVRLWMTSASKNGALVRQQVPYSALNEKTQLALTGYITSSASKEFLSNYVNGSQTIGGVELTGSTQYNQNLDIIFNEGSTILYGDGTAGDILGTTKTVIGDNTFSTEIRVDKNLSAEEMATTLGHESFLHANGSTNLLLDNFKQGMTDKEKSNLQGKISTGSQDHKNRSLRTGVGSTKYDRYLNSIRGFFLNSSKINDAIKREDDDNNKNVQNGH